VKTSIINKEFGEMKKWEYEIYEGNNEYVLLYVNYYNKVKSKIKWVIKFMLLTC